MIQFILANLLMVSLGVVVYLFVHVAVRMNEPLRRPGYITKLITSDIPERLDVVMVAMVSKLLRRAKIVVLKMDNFISFRLKSYREKDRNVAPKYDFGALMESGEVDKNV